MNKNNGVIVWPVIYAFSGLALNTNVRPCSPWRTSQILSNFFFQDLGQSFSGRTHPPGTAPHGLSFPPVGCPSGNWFSVTRVIRQLQFVSTCTAAYWLSTCWFLKGYGCSPECRTRTCPRLLRISLRRGFWRRSRFGSQKLLGTRKVNFNMYKHQWSKGFRMQTRMLDLKSISTLPLLRSLPQKNIPESLWLENVVRSAWGFFVRSEFWWKQEWKGRSILSRWGKTRSRGLFLGSFSAQRTQKCPTRASKRRCGGKTSYAGSTQIKTKDHLIINKKINRQRRSAFRDGVDCTVSSRRARQPQKLFVKSSNTVAFLNKN